MPKILQPEDENLERLIVDASEHKAILYDEAVRRYGADVVAAALNKRYFLLCPTPQGNALCLAHKGRKRVGLRGGYHPSGGAVSNALALRHVILDLKEKGYEVEMIDRKSAIRARKGNEDFIAIARYTGYDYAAIRRVFESLVASGEAPQLRVYVGADKIGKLDDEVWPKTSGRLSITSENLKLLEVPEYPRR
ncbi:hypothetical protein [Deinococcus phoenicis]|uniref:hypothetical protein n=1 Tax=Deinococcus phoenicis TaxID=1476583 RepID=UPI00126845EA|nr:hypothetical protein [Deinococcus phoenicis]